MQDERIEQRVSAAYRARACAAGVACGAQIFAVGTGLLLPLALQACIVAAAAACMWLWCWLLLQVGYGLSVLQGLVAAINCCSSDNRNHTGSHLRNLFYHL